MKVKVFHLKRSLQESNLLWPAGEAGKSDANVMPQSLVTVFQVQCVPVVSFLYIIYT